MERDLESSHLLSHLDVPKGHVEEEESQGQNKTASESTIKSLWFDTSVKDKLTLAYAAASTASIYFCQSVPGTFLARVIDADGGEKFYAAAIFNSTYLVASVASLVYGKYQALFPVRKLVWFSLMLVAITQGSLAFLQMTKDIYSFLVIGIIAKAVQGVGQGFFNVSILTLLWRIIPDQVEKVFALIKSMISLGYFLGPVAGGYLFSLNDQMTLPFVASALPPFTLSIVGLVFLPEVKNNEKDDSHYPIWSCILNPKSILALGLAATCGGSLAVYDASFTTYAQTLAISVVGTSWIMLVGDVVITLTSFFVAYVSNLGYVVRRAVIVICFAGVVGISFAFVADQTLVDLYFAVSFYGAFAVSVQTLGFAETMMQSVSFDENLKSNFNFQCKLSSVWFFIKALTMATFGIFGTGMQSYYPYFVSQAITLFVGVSVTLGFSLLMMLRRYHAS